MSKVDKIILDFENKKIKEVNFSFESDYVIKKIDKSLNILDKGDRKKLFEYLINNQKCLVCVLSLKKTIKTYIHELYEQVIEALILTESKMTEEDFCSPVAEKRFMFIDLLLSYYVLSEREDDNIEAINKCEPSKRLHNLIKKINFKKKSDFIFIFRRLNNYLEKKSEAEVISILEDVLNSGCYEYTNSITYMMECTVPGTEAFNETGEMEFDDDLNDKFDSIDESHYIKQHVDAELTETQEQIIRVMRLMYEKELWEALEIFQHYVGGMNAVYKAIGMNQHDFCKILNEKSTVDSLRFEYKILEGLYEQGNKQQLIENLRNHRNSFLEAMDGKYILKRNDNSRRWMVLFLLVKELMLRVELEPSAPLNKEILDVLNQLDAVNFRELGKPSRPSRLMSRCFNMLLENSRFDDVKELINIFGDNNIFKYNEEQKIPFFGSYNSEEISFKTRFIAQAFLLPYNGKKEGLLKKQDVIKIYMNTHLKCYIHLQCFLNWYYTCYPSKNIKGDTKCVNCTRAGIDDDCKDAIRTDGILIDRDKPLENYKVYGIIENKFNDGSGRVTVVSTNIRRSSFYYNCLAKKKSLFAKYFNIVEEGDAVQLLFKRFRIDEKTIEVDELIIEEESSKDKIIKMEEERYNKLVKVLKNIKDDMSLNNHEEDIRNATASGDIQSYRTGYNVLDNMHDEVKRDQADCMSILFLKEPLSAKRFLELLHNNNLWRYNSPNKTHNSNFFIIGKDYEKKAKDNLKRLMEAKINVQDLIYIYMNSYFKSSLDLGYFVYNILLNDDKIKQDKADLTKLFGKYEFYGVYENNNSKIKITSVFENSNPTFILSEGSNKFKGYNKQFKFKLKSWIDNTKDIIIEIS